MANRLWGAHLRPSLFGSDDAFVSSPLPVTPHKPPIEGDGGIAAGVVLAAHDVPAEGRRAAALDRAHHLELGEAQVTAIGLTPSGPVVAEDIRDLQAHAGPALCWRL